MLWCCKAGHSKSILVLNLFSILCNFIQCITIFRFLDFHRNTTEHRQRAAVKGNETTLVAFYKVSDRFLQFCPAHLAAVSGKLVWHDHVARHFFCITGLQYISCKAVCCCNQHICPINTAQSVCHNRIGFIASAGMETIGISFL